MLKIGDVVEAAGYRGRVANVLSHGLVTVTWSDGGEGEFFESQLTKVYQTNRFNFVIFKNYDGTTEGKRIPRSTFNRLMSAG